MGANASATISLKAILDVASMRGSIGNIQSALNKLKLPNNITTGLDKSANDLLASLEKLWLNEGKTRTAENLNNLYKDLGKVETAWSQFNSKLGQIPGLDKSQINMAGYLEGMKQLQEIRREFNLAQQQMKQSQEYKNLSREQAEVQKEIKTLQEAKSALEGYAQAKRIANQADTEFNDINDKVNKNDRIRKRELDRRIRTFSDKTGQIGNLSRDTSYETLQEALNFKLNTKEGMAGFKDFLNQKFRIDIELDRAKLKEAKDALEDIAKAKKKYDAGGSKVDEKTLEMARAKKADADAAKRAIENSLRKANISEEMLAKGNIGQIGGNLDQQLANARAKAASLKNEIDKLFQGTGTGSWDKINQILSDMSGKVIKLAHGDFRGLQQTINDINTQNLEQVKQIVSGISQEANKAGGSVRGMSEKMGGIKVQAHALKQTQQEFDRLQYSVQYFFGINNALNLFKRSLRSAFNTVKELDKAMTETAVVTDYSVEDMWNKLPQYTNEANKLGATTKGAYETMTLYYQQGLNTNQAFALGTETMKMARVANMDYADATNMMTAALRGFNMELNETSAQRVNDVYSELAAITAANTSQIATAMTKTASIAANANMEFETTAAFLSQIIETTQEAPETAGTAMKTIIARFTEVKEGYMEGRASIVDEEGETADINKIDKALKTVGISLKDFLNGSKGIDDIFIELAEKWDTLDTATQRYIATTAAGSRQQSRFIAMMSDYDRTMELVTAAQNSAGSGQEQFEKTLDSLESKLNQMHNAWDEFTMGLLDSGGIKLAVDGLTKLLNILNKLTSFKGGGLAKIALGAMGLGVGGSFVRTGVGLLAGQGMGRAVRGTLDAYYGTDIVAKQVGNLSGAALNKKYGSMYRTMLAHRAFGPFYSPIFGAKGRHETDAWLMNRNAAKPSSITKRQAELAKTYRNGLTPQQMTKEGAYSSYHMRFGSWLHNKHGWGAEGAKGLKGLGTKLGATAGNASSALISLGATLGIFASAALAAYTAVKAWDNQHISLEEAKTAAENAQQAEKALADKREKFNSALNSYNSNQEKVNKTTKGSAENLRAVAESNQHILEMAKLVPDLRYEYDSTTGALSVSQQEQQRVKGQLAEQERISNINTLLSQTLANEKQIAENNRQIEKITKSATLYDEYGNNLGEYLSKEQELEVKQLETKNITQQAQQQSLYATAVGEITQGMLSGLEGIEPILAQGAEEVYQNTLEQSEVGILRGRRWLTNELKELTGLTEQEILDVYGDGNKLNKEEARLAIQQFRAMESFNMAVEASAVEVEEFAAVQGKDVVNTISGIMSGETSTDLSKLIQDGAVNGELVQDFFTAAGIEFEDGWKNFFTGLDKIQKERAEAEFIARKSVGLNERESNYAAAQKGLDENERQKVNSMAQQLFNLAGEQGQAIFQQLMTGSINEQGAVRPKVLGAWDEKSLLSEKEIAERARLYGDLFSEINFNNPVKAFSQIKEYANSSNEEVKLFGQEMSALAQGEGPLSLSAQFDFLNDSIFSDVDALSEFVDANGELTGEAVGELADEFSDLSNFIEETGIKATTLAEIVNGIHLDGVNSNLITSNIIKAIDVFNSATNGITTTLQAWEDLDLGKDFGAATDAFVSAGETFIEQISKGEWGNQQAENFYNHIFGEGAYRRDAGDDPVNSKILEQNAKNINKWIESAKETGDLSQMVSDLYATTSAEQRKIQATGDEKYSEYTMSMSDGKIKFDFGKITPTFDQMAADLANLWGLSDEMARTVLTDIANNSGQLTRILDTDAINAAISEMAKDEDGIIDTAAIKLIAEQTSNPKGYAAALRQIFEGKTDTFEGENAEGDFVGYVDSLVEQKKITKEEGVAFKELTAEIFNGMIEAFKGSEQREGGYQVGTWEGNEAATAWEYISSGKTYSGDSPYVQQIIDSGAMRYTPGWNPSGTYRNFNVMDGLSMPIMPQAYAAALQEWETTGDSSAYDKYVGANGNTPSEEYSRYLTESKQYADALAGRRKTAEVLEGAGLGTAQDVLAKMQGWTDTEKVGQLQGATDFAGELAKMLGIDDTTWGEIAKHGGEEYLNQFKDVLSGTATFNQDELSKILGGDDAAFDFMFDSAQEAGANSMKVMSKEIAAYNNNQPLEIPITPTMTKEEAQASMTAQFNDLKWQSIGESIGKGLGTIDIQISGDAQAALDAADAAVTTINAKTATISINGKYVGDDVPQLASGGQIAASGGVVPSYASGSVQNKLQPGPALTGEEGPEIVWNKEVGYAYMAGAHGPEYNSLRSGDRVFNASETRRILANSRRNKRPSVGNALASGGYIGGRVTPSYAGASAYDDPGWFGGGGSGGGSGDKKKDKTYTELDWLYNLMEEIAQLEREQTELQRDLDKAMTDPDATIEDLVKLITDQISNLEHQLEASRMELEGRQLEMKELQEQNEKYSEYASYNEEEKRIEIDWDAIGAIKDGKKRKEVEDYVKSLEEVQDKMDEAEDRIADTEDAIKEAQETLKDSYIDFEERVLDAIVTLREAEIDKLSEVNDSISDTNSKLLEAVQKSIDKQRQDRENARTEEDLSEKERRLAYLRQDTSKNNDLEIKQLEKELADSKEDYTDTLIDQKMSALQEQQDLAAEQRSRQIELMEAQLEFEKANGLLWAQVAELMAGGVGEDGKIDKDSPLWDLLYEAEEVTSKSEAQQQEWSDEVATTFVQAMAWLEGEGFVLVDEDLKAIEEELKEIRSILPDNSIIEGKKSTSTSSGDWWGRTITVKSSDGSEWTVPVTEEKKMSESEQDYWDAVNKARGLTSHKQGGLVDYTGPHWLDGTKSKPELVLNARDTANFIQLKDVLADAMRGTPKKNDDKPGDTYIDIAIQAEIKEDYDVEKLAKKIKTEIYKDGAYRGVNIIRNIR